MSGLEAVGAASAVLGLASAAKKVYEIFKQVPNGATYRDAAERILKTAELIEKLSRDHQDRIDNVPGLPQSLFQSLIGLDQLYEQSNKAFKPRKGIKGAIKTYATNLWNADKIKEDLLGVEKGIGECYSHLLIAVATRTEIRVAEIVSAV